MSEAGHILHVDMDAFYYAVELIDHPELANQPVVIGSPPDKRGVVSTASYEARKYGIHSAMPSRTAAQKCPHAIFLPVRMARYSEVSRQVMTLIESFTPTFQQISVDEAFLDLRGVLHIWKDPVKLAIDLKRRLKEDIGLTGSVGVAPNKFLAKLCSDMEKPDGLTIAPTAPDAITEFLAPLPIRDMWGVGKKTAERLARIGILTFRDAQEIDPELLARKIGPSQAEHIHALAFGRDDRAVVTETEAKSISSEHTYGEDCDDPDQVRQTLIEQAGIVGYRLRASGKTAGTGQVKLRYADFRTLTRQMTFASPTNADLDLVRLAGEIFDKLNPRSPIRLIGFGVSGFDKNQKQMVQADLFSKPEEATKPKGDLDAALDKIRKTYGKGKIGRGVAKRETDT